MLAAGLRILQVALGIACMLLLYGTVNPLLSRSEVPESTLPELSLPAERSHDLASLEVIQSRNLFATLETADQAPSNPDELLEESGLQFQLRGTAAAEAQEASVAVLVDSTGESFVVRVRDKLGSTGAEVERIERGRIVIFNRGKREQISLVEPEGDGTAMAKPSGRAVARAVRPGSAAANRAQLQTDRLRHLRQSQGSGGRSRPSRAQADEAPGVPVPPPEPPEPAAQAARALGEGGTPDFPVQPPMPTFPKLRAGQRIIELNGEPIGDLSSQLRSGPPWTFTILDENTGLTETTTVAE